MEKILKRVAELKKNNCTGFTLNIETLTAPTSGYSVAYEETQDSFGLEGLKDCIRHAETHAGYIGGWFYEGKFYYDSVRIFEDKEEALKFGKDNHQIGIYNINEQETILITKE